jgi:RNA polymerase sigma factor (sigma-70 family)
MGAHSPPSVWQVAEAVLLDPRQRSKLTRYAETQFGIAAADAEDLLQDTALELLRQRGHVRNADGFVFAVFRRRCGYFVEARRRRRELLSEKPDRLETVAHPAEPEKLDRQVAVREALCGISSSCRRLLSAYYIEGQSLREAAGMRSVTHSVLSRRISRCLERLRACLN